MTVSTQRTAQPSVDPPPAHPLSTAQRRMWFASSYAPDSAAYNQPYVLRLSGPLDATALVDALRDLVAAHPVLRGLVEERDGEPYAVFQPVDRVPIAVVDGWDESAAEAEARRPFDLRTEVPTRATLYRLRDTSHVLALTFHHIALDAWSYRLLRQDLAVRYLARLGEGRAPGQPAVDYAEFVAWERERDISAGLEWWAERLAGLEPPPHLPHDRPRSPDGPATEGSLSFELPTALTRAVRALARASRCTPFTVLVTAFQTLLATASGREDIAVAVPAWGRDDPRFEQTVGSFVNTVVVRTDLGGEPSTPDALHRVRDGLLAALEHSGVPFERVVRRLALERAAGAMPLVDALVNLTTAEGPTTWADGLTVETGEIRNGAVKFDLALYLSDARTTIHGRFAYHAGLFDAATVARWRDGYLALLTGMTEHPERPVTRIPVGPAEGRTLAGPRARIPSGLLHPLIDRWVTRTPEAIAAVGPDGPLSYGRLGSRAARLARRLRAAGVAPDQPVAVHCDRRTDLVTAMLGVLRAGGCYLPVDETLPAGRLATLLDTAGVRVVLTTRRLAPGLPAGERLVLPLDDLEDADGFEDADDLEDAGARPEAEGVLPPVTPASLAYTIFTSGSTGTPKGVGVEHRHITHYLHAVRPAMESSAPGIRSFALLSTHAADLGLTSLLGALTTGRTVHLVDAETGNDPERLGHYLRTHPVDAVKCVPSQLEMLAGDAELGPLLPRRLLVLGGEACSWELVRRIRRAAPELVVQTSYGPTETTVSVLTCDVAEIAEELRHGVVPLGRPLANVDCQVTDPSGRPVPPGTPGELWIGGPTVARGYLGDEEGTAARFRVGPEGRRRYRTGDRVRQRPDGVLEFLGRLDDQVKIRGHRVEPGEVATALRGMPGVAAAHVLPVGAGHTRQLRAWVTPEPGASPDGAGLRVALRRRMPHHLVPARIAVLDRLPLTRNGKVDRGALLAGAPPERPGARGPRSEREHILCGLFSEVLGVPTVGIDDDFFALGGHSLLAARLAARIRAALGVGIGVRALFDAPTVAELAPALTGASGHPPVRPAARRPELVPLSGGQRALWFLHQMDGADTGYNQCYPWRLTGPLDIPALEQAIHDVVERHDILRTVFQERDGEPYQRVLPRDTGAPTLAVATVDEADLAERLATRARSAFDLATGTPLRTDLLSLGPQDHVLVWTMHHIAGDGWSAGIIRRDLARAYRSRREGRPPAWEPLPLRYADYALWEHALLADATDPQAPLGRQLAYWTTRLAGLPDRLTLPWDRPPGPTASFSGASVAFRFDAELHRGLGELARKHHVTLFMVLQAGLAALLTRLGAGTDIPVGTPVAGRPDESLHDLVGFFANTLVLRTDTSGAPTFTELLARVREGDLAAYDHQELPFERLVDEINPARSMAHNPLFQVLLVLQNNDPEDLRLPGLDATRVPFEHRVAKFDLSVQFVEHLDDNGAPAGLAGDAEFSTDLFDTATVVSLTRRLERLLRAVVADPDARITRPNLLSARERRALPTADHRPAPETGRSVPELFRAQAARAPGAVAVEHGDALLTYAELDARSDALATVLRERGGVRRGERVALLCAPGAPAVVAALAVLKCAATLVPRDPADLADPADPADPGDPGDPGDAVREVAASARLVLVDRATTGIPGALPIQDAPAADGWIDAPVGPPIHPDQPACLLSPGGAEQAGEVTVSHRSLVRLALAARATAAGSRERVLLHSRPDAETSLYELWFPLLTGGRIVVAPPGTADPPTPAHRLPGSGATGVWLGPGTLQRIVATRPELLSGVRRLWTTADGVPAAVLRRLWEHCPAITVVLASFRPEIGGFDTSHTLAADAPLAAGPPRARRPLNGITAWVLDPWLNPLPPGVTGELYLTAEGLTGGPTADAPGTAARLVACPFGAPGTRMVRTGELARYTAAGALEHLGRAAERLASGGVTVSPDEVAAALAEHPEIAETIALPRRVRPGERRVVCYAVPTTGSAPHPARLAQWVEERLPGTHALVTVMVLGQLPLTPDGRPRHRMLPLPRPVERESDDRPPTPAETALAVLFAQVLGLARVGVHDDFFRLGGSSLLAMRLVVQARGKLGLSLTAQDVFARPTVSRLAAAARPTATTPGPATLPLRPRPERLPLSAGQQRLWYLHQLGAGATAYNVPFALRLTGALDVPALRLALADLTARHEPLRTLFPEHDGTPTQRVLPPPATPAALPLTDTDEHGLRALLDGDRTHRFDLAARPPLRAALYRLGPNDHVLSLVFHHIVVDGWSEPVLWRDLATAYAARRTGTAPAWSPLPVQYADYTLWQRETLETADTPGSAAARGLAYWRETLAGLPARLALPAERPRSGPPDHEGGHVVTRCAPEVYDRLTRLARSSGATTFMVLHTAVATLLDRLGAGTDIPVGTVVAGRGHEALDDLVGFLVNTLVLRVDTSGAPTFRALLERVADTDRAAFAHQDVPFERVVREVNPGRSAAANPIFRVMLSLASEPAGPPQLPGLRGAFLETHADGTKFDLTITFVERRSPRDESRWLDCVLGYRTQLFDRDAVRRLGTSLIRVLEQATARPDLPIRRITLLPPGEALLLRRWNATDRPLPTTTPAELFDEQATRTPRAVAVRTAGEELTYAELRLRAERLADRLAAAGAGPERFVAIRLPRGTDLVIAVLAVLKAGAAYLPIDPGYPAARAARMLDEVRPVLVLEDAPDDPARPPAAPRKPRHPAHAAHQDHPAYAIYTSGSTGRPKGVVVTRRGLTNQLLWQRRSRLLGPGDVMLAHSSIGFDASVWEIWAALTSGATLAIAPDEVSGRVDLLVSHLTEQGVTHGLFVPSLLAAMTPLLDAADRERLTVLSGGEALPAPLARAYRRIVNLYGPTEATVLATTWQGTVPERDGGHVPLGRPVANTRAHVLDAALRPVPVGVAGELYLAGAQITRGYVNRPGLTAERFLADPHGPPGTRMYRTGDLARWRDDGVLEFLGRADDQVKIRGFRVEPGEIAAEIATADDVAQAVVVPREAGAGDTRLAAYVVPAPAADGAPGNPLTAEALRRRLTGALPHHLVPADITLLPRLPLLPNGKLDRRALPAPAPLADRAPGAAPRTPREELLCELFAEALDLPRVGTRDDFFALGGHSLLSVRLVSRIREVLGADLTIADLLAAPTVADLVAHLNGARGESPFAPVLPLRAGGTRPPLFCVHPVIGLSWSYLGLARHLPHDVPLIGLQARGIENEGTLPTSVTEMAHDYLTRITRLQPTGPYRLLGWSFGGLVAQAMAAMLQRRGEHVSLLALLDSYPSSKDPARRPDPTAADAHLRHGALSALDEARRARVATVTANNLALGHDHTPPVFHGDALFLLAEHGRTAASPTPDRWQAHIEGGITVRTVPCGHYDLMRPGALPEIAGLVGAELAET
ncbi:non-ribosomal peptide synthetase [Streptomyces sp. NBRC 109706]|uniref:non-ribosomal peptide synthetase n=1 Tax=Streptomyces sp. NBRC 109706 TaxID=1550035 RepID=UPI0007831FFF|nr:non-ribosomal peptide synthetase [Streptomyces sp. NBRC 109706]